MIRKIGYVSTFPPRRCGIATYTEHLRSALAPILGFGTVNPLAVLVDPTDPLDSVHLTNQEGVYPVRYEVRKDYARAATWLNHSSVDLVSVQHEFGIFGGLAGEYVLDLMERLTKPIVTTFHTVFLQPHEPYTSLQEKVIQRSDGIVVMNRQAVDYIVKAFHVSREKIRYIPHGTPALPEQDKNGAKKQLGWSNRKVILTFGLLNRGKGVELILKALPEVVRQIPEVLYVVAGQTHPNVLRYEGEKYRNELMELVTQLHLEEHVHIEDRYLDEQDLVRFISASDLYVTPYPGMEQITSGTLAYAVGLGKPVLSTPYVYAKDLLHGHEELLLPYGDVDQWQSSIVDMLEDEQQLKFWERKMRTLGRSMQWSRVGQAHMDWYQQVLDRWMVQHSRDVLMEGMKQFAPSSH
ncbi:glycosyltransferase [Alicyclobacillaceae bacterium I2511]|nr:glycosyltransferase [Alicyclobacillaceae bacterium I2511]